MSLKKINKIMKVIEGLTEEERVAFAYVLENEPIEIHFDKCLSGNKLNSLNQL